MSSGPRHILDAPGGGPEGHRGPSHSFGTPPPPQEPQPRPWVCYAIIAICVGVFALEELGMLPAFKEGKLPLGALYGPAVQAGQYWRLLAVAFEHGGILHLAFNMSVVVTLGFTLERGIGSLRFAGLSLVTALGSSAFSLLFDFDKTMVGASGMILGWAGAMIPIATRQGRRELGIWLVQVAVLSLLPGVSWSGHLGGFLFGLPCGVALRQGRRVYALALPIILFLTAVVALFAAHPERRGGF
ncbi:rhomboid family intramembrane serine protease [Myxococcus stipitatus]|uniref:rhomboid family intramembrane serine protease n=1 Tax=Myxococcus stipitatus TaxID=83455 RepID=UPI0030CCE434